MGRAAVALLVIVFVVLLVSSLRDQPQPATTPTKAVATAPSSDDHGERNPAHRQLIRLSDAERNRTLAAFMRASGERCGRVTRSFYQGSTPDAKAMWNIRCSAMGDWTIMVEPDAGGSTTIMECDMLKMVDVWCWERFES